MKTFPVLFAIIASAVVPGCIVNDQLRMGGAHFVPNNPDNVLILDQIPSWNYAEVGLVQTQAGPFARDVSVYRKLQEAGAKVGAQAVIVKTPFIEYAGRGEDEYIGRALKGTAIVRTGGDKRGPESAGL